MRTYKQLTAEMKKMKNDANRYIRKTETDPKVIHDKTLNNHKAYQEIDEILWIYMVDLSK